MDLVFKKMISKKGCPYFYIAIFLIWFVFNFFCSLNHFHFRDEGQAWMIAKILSFDNFKYVLADEGHGLFWFLFLKPFQFMGLQYKYFSFLTLGVMSISVIILLKANINNLLKILLLFSPVFSFYNTAIARTYSVCILFLVIILYFYPKRNEINPIFVGAFVFLLPQTHLYLAPIAGALALWLVYKAILNKEKRLEYIMGGLLALSGFVTVYFTLCRNLTPFSNPNYGAIMDDLIKIPNIDATYPEIEKWNFWLFWALFASIVISAFINIKLCLSRLIFLFISTGGIILLQSLYSACHQQHKILCIAISLLGLYFIAEKICSTAGGKFYRPCFLFFAAIYLILSVYYPVETYNREAFKQIKYSNAKYMADWILNNFSDEKITVGIDNDKFPNLAAYLGEKNNLFQKTGEKYIYFDRTNERLTHEKIRNFFEPNGSVFYIFEKPQIREDFRQIHAEARPTKWEENFYLYKIISPSSQN